MTRIPCKRSKAPVGESNAQADDGMRPQTALQLVLHLCGAIRDGPADLATNPEHLRDFGR